MTAARIAGVANRTARLPLGSSKRSASITPPRSSQGCSSTRDEAQNTQIAAMTGDSPPDVETALILASAIRPRQPVGPPELTREHGWTCLVRLGGRAVTRRPVSIGPAAVKAVNLAKQPYVELHLGDGDDVVVVRGTAQRITAPTELATTAAAVRAKYVDPGSGARAELGEIAYRVEVGRIYAWMYGVSGHRTDWPAGSWSGHGPV